MIKQKEVYTSPLTEVLVVRFEDALLTGSPVFGSSGSAGADAGLGEDEFNYGSF